MDVCIITYKQHIQDTANTHTTMIKQTMAAERLRSTSPWSTLTSSGPASVRGPVSPYENDIDKDNGNDNDNDDNDDDNNGNIESVSGNIIESIVTLS